MNPFSSGPPLPPSRALLETAPPAVHRHLLPNGLTLLIQESRAHPLVAFHAVVRTGSATEGEYLGTGVSHVVEHMLFKGTARRPVGAVEREARSYGGTTQGMTSFDTTSYSITVQREFWAQAADLLVDALFFPGMDSAEFAKEREVVLRELRLRRDDPGQIAWDLLFAHAYRLHPYRLPIIGLEPLLTKLTVEDVRAYHRRHYLPNACVISVVGDLEAEAVIRRFEELTAALPPGRPPLAAVPEEPPVLSAREVVQEAPIQLATVAVGFQGVPLNDSNLYALDLLAWILGGGRGSDLERALKETGLVHSVSCWNYTPMWRGLFVVSLRTDPDKVAPALTRLQEELQAVRELPADPRKLEAAKRAFAKEYLQDRQTVGGQASDLASSEVATGDPLFAHRYLNQIQRLQTEDLQAAARSFLVSDRATTVQLFPQGVGKQETADTQEKGRAPARKAQLPNGVRIILEEDHRLPLVTFQLSVRAGVRYEEEESNGLSLLTARMLLRGTRRRSADELADLVRRMGGDTSAFSGRNSLGVTFQVVAPEAAEAARLLGEIWREPVFPQEELEKERRLGLAGLKAQEEDPFSWGMRRLASTLFREHPYRLDPAGTEKAWRRFRREDLVAFHERVLDPAHLVIGVAGDFRSEELLAILTDSFGALAPRAEPVPAIAEEPPLTERREHLEATPRKEALLLIGFPGVRLSDPRLPAVDLVEELLSGGAGRLFGRIREEKGLAYTVGAVSVPGIDPGTFILYAVTDPSRVEEVRRALLEEIRGLRADVVPAKELEEARQGLLGARRIARQSQESLVAQRVGDELAGLGFDFSDRYEQAVRSLAAADLRKVAADLLDPDRCVWVIGRPGEGTEAASGSQELLEEPAVSGPS